mgnify:CR=1 FL=1
MSGTEVLPQAQVDLIMKVGCDEEAMSEDVCAAAMAAQAEECSPPPTSALQYLKRELELALYRRDEARRQVDRLCSDANHYDDMATVLYSAVEMLEKEQTK